MSSFVALIKNITDESLFNRIMDRYVEKVISSKTHSIESNNTLENDVINYISTVIDFFNPTKRLEDFFGMPLSCTKPITNPEKINYSLAKVFITLIATSENPELALKYMERFLNKELVSTYEYIATKLCKDTYENGFPYYISGYNDRESVKETIFIQLLASGEIKMLKNIDDQLLNQQYKRDANEFIKKLPKIYPELLRKHELSYYEKKLLDFLEKYPDYRRTKASNLVTDLVTGFATGAGAVFNAFIDSED